MILSHKIKLYVDFNKKTLYNIFAKAHERRRHGMDFQEYFPIWSKLNEDERSLILSSVSFERVLAGSVIHRGHLDCTGVLLIKRGQLRAYILSSEGRQVSVYRLFDHDMCLLTASCMMSSIQFEIMIEAEKDTEMWVIPTSVYKSIMLGSAPLANYTSEVMATRFSDAMWLIEQILWNSMDKRLAKFLVEESSIEDSDSLNITHEAIANHIGTHREVVTRMLRYFQNEGIVKLSRGTIDITDLKKLIRLGNK